MYVCVSCPVKRRLPCNNVSTLDPVKVLNLIDTWRRVQSRTGILSVKTEIISQSLVVERIA